MKNLLPTRIRALAPCRLVHLVDPMVLCHRDPFIAKVTAYRGEVTLLCWLGTLQISYTVRQRDLLFVSLFDLGTKKLPGLLRN